MARVQNIHLQFNCLLRPSTGPSRQHLDGLTAGLLLPTRRRIALRGPDAEQRSADTGSVSPGLLPDGCKQAHCTDMETEAQRGGVTHHQPGTSKAGAESDLRTREDGAGSTGEAQTEGAELERVLYPHQLGLPGGQSYTRAGVLGPRRCLQRGAGMGSGGSPPPIAETEPPSPRAGRGLGGHPPFLSVSGVGRSASSRFLCTPPPPQQSWQLPSVK